jgi:phosphatidylglycerophosphate synthase
MLDELVRKLFESPLIRLAGVLQRLGVGANTVTVIGFIWGLFAIATVAGGYFVLGLIFLTANRLADLLDGVLARRTRPTAFGGFLDMTLGYTIHSGLAFAFVMARQQNGLAGTFLILGLFADAVTALGARAYGVPVVRDEGPVPRTLILVGQTQTYILYAIMLLAPWTFGMLPYLFGVLCFVTAGARIAAAFASPGTAARS